MSVFIRFLSGKYKWGERLCWREDQCLSICLYYIAIFQIQISCLSPKEMMQTGKQIHHIQRICSLLLNDAQICVVSFITDTYMNLILNWLFCNRFTPVVTIMNTTVMMMLISKKTWRWDKQKRGRSNISLII